MTKSRKKKEEDKKKNNFKSLPVLSILKEGLHLIGNPPLSVICIMRKVHFPAIKLSSEPNTHKYFTQRYGLFSKYDEGIQLDDESWYSVTHEVIAEYIAHICRNCSIVMDGFAGVGGNVIQFAKHCKVLAVDIDKSKLKMLKNNANIYGVLSNIECIDDDFLNIPYRNYRVDVVFASPPWGGPSYLNSRVFDICEMVPQLQEILRTCEKIAENTILYLPKNLDPLDIYRVIMETGLKYKKIEFQVYYIGKNIKGIGCFLGELVHPDLEDLKLLLND